MYSQKTRNTLALIFPVILSVVISFKLFPQQCSTPASSDFSWSGVEINSFGPVFQPGISAMADNGDVYFAGITNNAIKVARWDGAGWSQLGEKLYRVGSGTLLVLAIDVASNGDVYIGGNFTHALSNLNTSPVPTQYIAKWDAANGEWTPVGQGSTNAVWEIKIDNNDLVYVSAEGGINPNGSVLQLNYAGRWNPNTNQWEILGNGLDYIAQKITFDSNQNPYYTGTFTQAFNSGGGTVNVNGIAKWDGNQWSTLGQGLLFGVLYASSGFQSAPNGNLYLVANEITGVNGNGSQVDGPVIFWDGSQWNNIAFTGLPLSGTAGLGPSAVVDGTGKLFVSYFTDSMYTSRKISFWDGSQWIDISEYTGADYVLTLATNTSVPGTKLYTGGQFTKITSPGGGITFPIYFNAIWDGTVWSGMTGIGGGSGGTVNAIEVEKAVQDVLYVGGLFNLVSNLPVNNIATFDGTSWGTLGNGVGGGVYDIEDNFDPFANFQVVGGDFSIVYDDDSTAVVVNNVAIWNGQWTPLGQGVNGVVTAVLPKVSYLNGSYYGGIVVAGNFTEAKNLNGTTVQVNSIAWWDWETNEWAKIGDGVTGGSKLIRSITEGTSRYYPVSQPNFYIGGDFTGGINTNQSVVNSSNILYWNNDSDEWESVGQGVDDQVYVVTLADPTSFGVPLDEQVFVFVGGEFQNSVNPGGSSIETKYISIWNQFSQQWLPVGGGVDNIVYTISSNGVVGGEFTTGYLGQTASVNLNHIGKISLSTVITGAGPLIWSQLGLNATNDVVRAIEPVGLCRQAGENLYVGGDFTQAGYFPANLLARWYFGYTPCYSGVNLVAGGSGGGGMGGNIGVLISGPVCTDLMTNSLFGESLMIDSLGFRENVILDSLWIQRYFDLSIFPAGNPGNPFVSFDSLFIQSNFPGTIIFTGVEDTSLYAPNPDGRSISANVIVKNYNFDELQPGNVELIFANAVTDAPAVDIFIQAGAQLVTDIPFGEFADQISLSPGNYTLDVKRNDSGQLLESFNIDISSNADQFNLLLLSGFVDPSSNQNGPPMSLDIYETGMSTILVGVEENENEPTALEEFSLMQNYPNPFNPITTIQYSIPQRSDVSLKVYDILGNEIATLVNEEKNVGVYTINFNASQFASGIYFYKLQAGGFVQTKKMILLR